MIRHLKMQIRREVHDVAHKCDPAAANLLLQTPTPTQPQPQHMMMVNQGQNIAAQPAREVAPVPAISKCAKPAPKRQRNRRSSKPQIEKRRRAHINQCLDSLKNYVLTDPTNLAHLGIDASSRENHDEESVARTILHSSGLINRHNGRKNPNKLEKADILELTVDYVERLHKQRDQLLSNLRSRSSVASPAHLCSNQLTIQVPGGGLALAGIPMSPPPSSASSSPVMPLLAVSSQGRHLEQIYSANSCHFNDNQQQYAQQVIPSAAVRLQPLDLSDSKRTPY